MTSNDTGLFFISMASARKVYILLGEYPNSDFYGGNTTLAGNKLLLYDGNTIKTRVILAQDTVTNTVGFSIRNLFYYNGKVYNFQLDQLLDHDTTILGTPAPAVVSWDGYNSEIDFNSSKLGVVTTGGYWTAIANRGIILVPKGDEINSSEVYIAIKSESLAKTWERNIAKESGGVSYPIDGTNISIHKSFNGRHSLRSARANQPDYLSRYGSSGIILRE